MWEDYLITYRCSKNLATGQGLVFTPGERVHAFTSPLNTLIPAALSVATGNTSDGLVLWLFRLVSMSALAGGAVLLYQIARAQAMGRLATFTLVGLYATLPGIVDYSINGQEIGLMMFFLALTLHSLLVPTGRPAVRLGLAWAGLMWTRPDGFVYAGAIAVSFLLFNAGSPAYRGRAGLVKGYVVAGLIGGLLYLPWVGWAWWYFGSPVPHTVIAKGLDHPLHFDTVWRTTIDFVERVFSRDHEMLGILFGPPYALFPEWPWWVFKGSLYLAWVGVLYWLLPFGHRSGRAVSLAFLLAFWYLCVLVPVAFPWYLPSAAFLGVFVLGKIVQQIADGLRVLEQAEASGYVVRMRDWCVSLGGFVLRAAVATAAAYSVAMLVLCAMQMRVQQREIERGNRMRIGLFLRYQAKSPRETVFLEPLGYIGFYSGLKTYDWPGLSSPEVVALRKKLKINSWIPLISELKPDWIVLRPGEMNGIRSEAPLLVSETYKPVAVFDVSERLKSCGWIPGRSYPMGDQTFTVLKRSEDKTD